MLRATLCICGVLVVALTVSPNPVMGQSVTTVFTDADATVRSICRNDNSFDVCVEPLGATEDFQLNVQDQNSSKVAYLHFDLSAGVPDGASVTKATFQLDTLTNAWGDTAVNVVAIADATQDWDLNTLPETDIINETAPMLDIDAFPWTGDPDVDGQQRFNAPLPFLEEGDTPADEVRTLVPFPDWIQIDDEDPFTEDAGNAYGGFVCCGYSSGEGGTAGGDDRGSNAWPVKNAIDLDVTDLVQWKLGQNAAYSDFDPTDTELTLMVRTEVGSGGNGFAVFVSKETSELGHLNLAPGGGLPALEPGRIVIEYTPVIEPGDFNMNGVLDTPDIDDLTGQSASGANDLTYDLNADTLVNSDDVKVWIETLFNSWVGDLNLDLEFNSTDLTGVLASGTYESGAPSVWSQGDFNGDGVTDSGDLTFGLAGGGYELGPKGVSAVPEPSSMLLVLLGAFAAMGVVRRR